MRSRHLDAEDLLDVIEWRASGRVRLHVERCRECRERALELRDVLRAVGRVGVPEPSPLFWERLSARVHQAVAAEPALRPGAFRLPRCVRLALPAAGMAAVAAALVISVALSPTRSPEPPLAGDLTSFMTGADVAAPADADPAWEVVMTAAADVEWDDLRAAGLVRPGTADLAALELSEDEQRVLIQLLSDEIEQTAAS